MACKIFITSADGNRIEVPISKATLKDENGNVLDVEKYTIQSLYDSLVKLKAQSDTLEKLVARVCNGVGNRLGCYTLNKENKNIKVGEMSGIISSAFQIPINLDSVITDIYVTNNNGFNFLFKDDGKAVLFINKNAAENGLDPAYSAELIYQFIQNFKIENETLIREETYSLDTILTRVEALPISDDLKQLLTTYIFDHALEQDSETKAKMKKARRALAIINKEGMTDTFYENSYHEVDFTKDELRPMDLVTFESDGSLRYGIILLSNAKENYNIITYDINGKMRSIGTLGKEDKNIKVRRSIFPVTITGKVIKNIPSTTNTRSINNNTILQVGDHIYGQGTAASSYLPIYQGQVKAVNNKEILINDIDGNLLHQSINDLVRNRMSYYKGSELSLYRVQTIDVLPGEFYISKDGTTKQFQKGADKNDVLYVLRNNVDVDPKLLEYLQLFKFPLYDITGVSDSDSILDEHASDPYFLILNNITDHSILNQKRKVFIQERPELGKDIKTISYDMGGLYLKQGDPEVGDIIEFKAPVEEVLGQDVNTLGVTGMRYGVLYSQDLNNKVAYYDIANECYGITTFDDLNDVQIYTHDPSKKQIPEDKLDLRQGLFLRATTRLVDTAAIKCLLQAFGNIPIVYVQSNDEYTNTHVKAYTDLSHIYINIRFKHEGDKKKAISQCYAHELSHLLLGYLRKTNAESYYQLINTLRELSPETQFESYVDVEEAIVDTIEKHFGELISREKGTVDRLYKDALDIAFKEIFGDNDPNGFVATGLNVMREVANANASSRNEFMRYVTGNSIKTSTQLQQKMLNDLKYICE